MNGNFYSWGLYIGTLFGIRVKIHWSLLLFWVYELNEVSQDSERIAIWALVVLLGFICIFLHELGHCFAARYVGGEATEVLLWPLGGLAFCTAPNIWPAQFKVAAGGPLVSLAIVVLGYVTFGLAASNISDIERNLYFFGARYVVTKWTLYIVIFNTIPLYPLDGGRMFHALAWGWFERRHGPGLIAYTKATLATLWASRITAALGLVYALYLLTTSSGSFLLVLIFIWAWSGAESLNRQLREGDGPDSVFGYDFSRGYTSVEGQRRPRRKKGPGFFRQLAAKRKEPKRMSAKDERRLDDLLEKITREGMGSLTGKERQFLEKLSKRKRGG